MSAFVRPSTDAFRQSDTCHRSQTPLLFPLGRLPAEFDFKLGATPRNFRPIARIATQAASPPETRGYMPPTELQLDSRSELRENPGNSVTRWISALKLGDQSAAQRLWEAYFRRLVGLAHARLRDAPRRIADEEDVALSAFQSFWQGAQAGRFPRLDDRNDLWQILVVITVRKAIDLRNYEGRPSRGRGRVQSLTDLTQEGLEAIGGDEPTPEVAAQLAEEYQRLMEQLGDPTLQNVATWKLEGYTDQEIASRLGCVTRTVERKLARIRQIWARETRD
jgi:DNA-directed RNA polymerase specialized sigma24 family protein